jgi:hypothetical protein
MGGGVDVFVDHFLQEQIGFFNEGQKDSNTFHIHNFHKVTSLYCEMFVTYKAMLHVM